MKSISFFILISIIFSCEYENASLNSLNAGIHFTNDIVPILNQHCSISGCHVAGATTGDFTKYEQLKSRIDNGKFKKMVFELRLMPPATYPTLSEEELAMLKDWIASGATQD